MGTLYYGDSGTPIGIDDRALAHLKVAITTKLRRGESFTLSWQHTDDQPRGRSTLWLHPAIPLHFVFDDPHAPRAQPGLDRRLMRSANSTGGIELVPEHLDTSPIAVEVPEPLAAEPKQGRRRGEGCTMTDTAEGRIPIERWWPPLSIDGKHLVLAALDGIADDEASGDRVELELDLAVVEEISGLGLEVEAPLRLTRRECEFIRTQIEAVD